MSTVTRYGAHVAVQVVTPGAPTASIYGQAVYGTGRRYTGAWPWTEVECDVTDATWTAGGSTPAGPLTRVESGTLSLAMVDRDGHWRPALAKLPLRTPVRLLAGPSDPGMVPVWSGWLEQVEWTPDVDGSWTVYLTADDVIRQLSAWPTVAMTRPPETASARLAALAAAVPANTGGAIPYPILGPYTAPNRQLAADTVDASVWDGMQDVADADLGWLRAGPGGTVAGVALPALPAGTLLACPDPAHPPGPLDYTWSWTTGTGTIAPNGGSTGVLVTPSPRSTAATWNCRARSFGFLPGGSVYRATARVRLVSGTPDGALNLIVGQGTQTPKPTLPIPTDGSWLTVDVATTVVDNTGSSTGQNPTLYVQTGGTAQVTVEVDQLLMFDTSRVVYADRAELLTSGSIVNSVAVTRTVPDGTETPPPVVMADQDSIARYLPAGMERTLPLPDDTAARTWAGQVLGWLARPRPHTSQLTLIASAGQGSDPATLDAMARLYPPTRVAVQGDLGLVEHLVVGVSHDLGPEQWTASYTLMPAPYDSTQVYGRPKYGQVRYGGVSV